MKRVFSGNENPTTRFVTTLIEGTELLYSKSYADGTLKTEIMY